MYNKNVVIPGIIIFVGLFTAPFWTNVFSGKHEPVKLELPKAPVKFFGEERTNCVEPREWMAANHMDLLISWRDEALRNTKRIYVATDGKKWETSLQNTCMASGHCGYRRRIPSCQFFSDSKPVMFQV